MDRDNIQELILKIKKFRDERDWEQFHNSKDLSVALSIEASELLELFLWKKTDDEINSIDERKIKEELADVFMYSFLLLDKMQFDLKEIIEDKINLNGLKYPISKSKGNSTKYNKFK